MLACRITRAKIDLQVEEGELAWTAAVFINESAGQVTAKDGTKIIVRYLIHVSKDCTCTVCV